MSLRHEILGLLFYKESTGYELTRRINSEGLFFWQAQQSQVYREITALEKDGLIVPGKDSTDYKKVFALTKKGKKELVSWLNEKDTQASVDIRNPLVMRLFFGNMSDHKKMLEMCLEYREECKKKIAEIAEAQEDVVALTDDKRDGVFFSLANLYGVGFYNFSVDWADKCITFLEKVIQVEDASK